METFKAATFRYKFTPNFQKELHEFAQLHRFDNRQCFKEAWTKWIETFTTLVETESKLLKDSGYVGNPHDKMYKSARYYFRKKKNTKDEPKQRRTYVSLNNNVIEAMDNHIFLLSRRNNFKPSSAFDDFCDTHKNEITDEVKRLYTEKNLSKTDIAMKFKKTYKNRYFQKIKSCC